MSATIVSVVGAAWGATEGADDVSDIVQGIVAGGTYTFTADRNTFHKSDPATGHKKSFGMVYQVTAPGQPPVRYAAACEEGEQVVLKVPVTT